MSRNRYALAIAWLVIASVAAIWFAYHYRWPKNHALLWGTLLAVIAILVVRMILPETIKKD